MISSENPDLFWALRGGGGDFGVVTSFEFQLHPLGPEVLSGLLIHPLDATAYPLRRPHFVMNVHTRWREKAQDDSAIKWARDLFEAMAPFAAGSAYVNFMPADEDGRVEQAYGANYRRLAAVKEHYDPHNLFRLNQSIRPA